LDEIDYKILEILRENAKTTNNDIAKTVKLTEGAVRNRIKRLVVTGIIKQFTIVTEPAQSEAIVLIKTRAKGSKEILKRIRKYTNRLFETAGEYDVATFIADESFEKINETIDELRGVDGVTATMTLLKIADEQLSRHSTPLVA
jgi:Lrp/AsnC family transcriptional regulator of lysine biosynthesis